MRSLACYVILIALFALAATQSHSGHRHFHDAAHSKREAHAEIHRVFVYALNGHLIPESEAQAGIANGTFFLVETGLLEPALTVSSAKSSTSLSNIEESDNAELLRSVKSSSSKLAPTSALAKDIAPTATTQTPSTITRGNVPTAKQETALSTTQKISATVSQNTASTIAKETTGTLSYSQANGVGAPFPDGEISCSDFPDQYGAISLEYLGLGGWTGIQLPRISGNSFDNIETVIESSCSGLDCCKEGAFCSYACPPGYQKSQWPPIQGATGQSVGGIQCRGGKLWLTNPAHSTLCMLGSSAVSIFVKNTMTHVSSICRTDYPGSESETVPLSAQPGTTSKLTCPEGENYYMWQGQMTSAQYYVNPKGVPIQKGCRWGKPGGNVGNFAPLLLGVGYSAGSAWLSIFQNAPTTNAKLDYTVEIVGDNGGFDNLGGRCRYKDGQYCSGDSYQSCSDTGAGCTVAVKSGSATFVLSE